MIDFFDDLINGLAQTMIDKKIKQDAYGVIGNALLVQLIQNSNSETLKKIFYKVYEEYKEALNEKIGEVNTSGNETEKELINKMSAAYDAAYKEIRIEVYKIYNHD